MTARPATLADMVTQALAAATAPKVEPLSSLPDGNTHSPATARIEALYRRWLAATLEPRALLTLDDQQVREAVAARVVSRDLAQTSVLILVRVPGAVGLLAVPAEKWAGFSPTAAIEALQAWH